jgi:hypothetical protein
MISGCLVVLSILVFSRERALLWSFNLMGCTVTLVVYLKTNTS